MKKATKNDPKNVIKIHEKSVLVAIKMETRKRMQKNIEKSGKMSKMDPKMGAQTWSFFGHLAPFVRARRPWEPKWLPSLRQEPQGQSKPRFPSIFG